MKIKFLLSFSICLLAFSLQAQNVIKVKSKHTKVLVYTMKEGEYITRNESRILIKNTGIDHEFVLQNKEREFKLVKNGKLIGTSSSFRFSDDEFWYTSVMEGDKKMNYLNLKSGKKIGPYSSIYATTSYQNGKYQFDGYQYTKNEKYYFHSFYLDKTFGPFDKLSIYRSSKGKIYFTYSLNDKDYVSINSKVFGPYIEAKFTYPYYPTSENAIFAIKYKNSDNQWKVFYEKELDYAFQYAPNIEFLENNKIKITGYLTNGENDFESIIVNDKVYKYKYNYYDVALNSFGEAMYIVKNNDGDSIFVDSKFLGVFRTENLYSSRLLDSPYYNILLKKKSSDNKMEYFLCKKDELISIGSNLEMSPYNFNIFKDDYYYIRTIDSVLIKNNKETEFKKVKDFYYTPDKKQVLMSLNGIYDEYFIDGKKVSYEEAKNANLNVDWANIKGKPYTFERVEDKYFITPKGSNKKFGPVIKWNKFVFSNDNLHYGECDENEMNVFIDGKLFSKGTSIVHNPKTNQFHWLSVDKNKVYFHTLMND